MHLGSQIDSFGNLVHALLFKILFYRSFFSLSILALPAASFLSLEEGSDAVNEGGKVELHGLV